MSTEREKCTRINWSFYGTFTFRFRCTSSHFYSPLHVMNVFLCILFYLSDTESFQLKDNNLNEDGSQIRSSQLLQQGSSLDGTVLMDNTQTPELRRYLKHHGSTTVYCNSPSKSLCPTVVGGTQWELDDDWVSADEVPFGSKWYVVMNDATVFCTALKKRGCPLLPLPRSWIMLPPDIKIYCRTTDDISCDVSKNRTWHRIENSISSTAQNMQGIDTEMLKSILAPSRGDTTLEIIPTKNTLSNDEKRSQRYKKMIDRLLHTHDNSSITNESLEVSFREHNETGDLDQPRAPDQPRNDKYWWAQNIGDATLFCASEVVENCPEIGGSNQGWRLDVKPLRNIEFETFLGDLPILCQAGTIEQCPRISETSQWHQKIESASNFESGDAKSTFEIWEMKIGTATIYCNKPNRRQCPIIKRLGGKSSWRPEQYQLEIHGVQNTKFRMELDGTPVLCSAPDIDQCPKLSRESIWNERRVDKKIISDSDSTTQQPNSTSNFKVWETDIGSATIYCNEPSKIQCPKIRGVGGASSWRPKQYKSKTQRVPNAEFRMVLGGTPVLCSAPDIGQCPILSRGSIWNERPIDQKTTSDSESTTEHEPSDSKSNIEIWVLDIGNATIYCNEPNRRQCPEIKDVRGASSWRPEMHKPGVPNAKFRMVLDGTPVLCSAPQIDQCPKLSRESRWHERLVGKNVESTIDNESKTSNKQPGIGIYLDTPAGHKRQEMKGIEITKKIGAATVYCRSPKYERSCQKIISTAKPGDWYFGPSESPYKVSEFVIPVGNGQILCQARAILYCPRISNSEQWRPSYNRSDVPITIPQKSEWMIGVRGATVYCNFLDKRKCPKIEGIFGNGDWFSTRRIATFETLVKDMFFHCRAVAVQLCPRLTRDTSWFLITEGTVRTRSARSLKKYINYISGGGSKFYETPDNTSVEEVDSNREKNSIDGYLNGNDDLDDELKRWKLALRDGEMYCVARNHQECPTIKDGDWVLLNSKIPVDDKWYIFFWKGLNISCHGQCLHALDFVTMNGHIKDDKADSRRAEYEKVDHVPYHTGNAQRLPEPQKMRRWVKQNGQIHIYCDSVPSKSCPAVEGQPNWMEVNYTAKIPNYTRWIKSSTNSTLYCDARTMMPCSLWSPGRWKTFTKIETGKLEEEYLSRNRQGYEPSKRERRWVKYIKDVAVYCSSMSLDECPVLRGDTDWKELQYTDDLSNKLKWIASLTFSTMYCDAQIVTKCPLLHQGDIIWRWNRFPSGNWNNFNQQPTLGQVKPYMPHYGDSEQTRDPSTKNEASLPVKNHYERHTYPRRWMKQKENDHVHCDSFSFENCLVMRGGSDWKEVKHTHKPPLMSVWSVNLRSSKMYCDANDVNRCPRIHGSSKWVKMEKDAEKSDVSVIPTGKSMDFNVKSFENSGGKWVNHIGDIEFYCETHNLADCPAIEGGSGWEPSDGLGCGRALPVKDTNVTYHHQIVKLCAEARGDILWLPVTQGDVISVSPWKQEEKTRLSCIPKDDTQGDDLPRGMNVKNFTFCHNEVLHRHPVNSVSESKTAENMTIKTWVNNVRYTKFYCKSIRVEKCPKLDFGGVWRKVPNTTKEVGKWQIDLGDTTVRCGSENVERCMEGVDTGIWYSIMSSEQRIVDSQKVSDSLYETEMKNSVVRFSKNTETVRMYCDAGRVDECPEGSGEWVRNGGKHPINDVPSGAKWSTVLGNSTIYCTGLSSEDCPEFLGNTEWKVVYSYDVLSRWKKRLGDTDIYCDAIDFLVDCPKIPRSGKWKYVQTVVSQDAAPPGSLWIAAAGSATIYCTSELDRCNEIVRTRWNNLISVQKTV